MRIDIGAYNTLTIARSTPQGFYLSSGVQEVLLPNRFITDEMTIDSEIEVFVLLDSEERLVATTQKPKGVVGEIVPLEVVGVTEFGLFLDWGLEGKDLFLPKPMQKKEVQVGDKCVVRIEIDKVTERLIANPKIAKHLEEVEDDSMHLDEEVEALIYDRSPLGFSCIVNGKYSGMLYLNEVFRKLKVGDSIKAYVRFLREDGKLDLSLRRSGFDGLEGQEMEIMEMLEEAGGFLPYNDSSDPQDIRQKFKMSKKSFKKLIGVLYKKRLINITHKGIATKTHTA